MLPRVLNGWFAFPSFLNCLSPFRANSVNTQTVKVWRDWLIICEITRAAREYKKNTKVGEEEKNCYLKFKNEKTLYGRSEIITARNNNGSRFFPSVIVICFLLVNYFVVYIYERGCCSVNYSDVLGEKDLRVRGGETCMDVPFVIKTLAAGRVVQGKEYLKLVRIMLSRSF